MDFPTKVPSAGLVNGKFVDENPLTGTPGSLIPASWGNGVTDEIVNVIKSAAIVPDQDAHNQLQQAITKNINDKLPGQATETIAGVMKVATQDQVVNSLDDMAAVTSKKLKLGFSSSFGAGVGYVAFPSWLGSFIIQWGWINSAITDVITPLVVNFNSNFSCVIVCNDYTANSGSIGYLAATPRNLSSIVSRGSSKDLGARYIAVGK